MDTHSKSCSPDVKAFQELMMKYRELKAKAQKLQGDTFDEEQFHQWFTYQVSKLIPPTD